MKTELNLAHPTSLIDGWFVLRLLPSPFFDNCSGN